jgi:hypothetical protein
MTQLVGHGGWNIVVSAANGAVPPWIAEAAMVIVEMSTCYPRRVALGLWAG